MYQIAAVSGVSAGLLLIIYAYLHCRIRGDGDRAVIHQSVDELRQQSFRLVFKDSIWALMTPVLILGTIFSGIADTAQAAVVSLAYSILVAVFVYRTIRPEEILPLFRQCILSAAPLCFLIALSNVFSAGMSALDIPARLANALIHSGVSSRVLILLVLGCMLLLSAFMDCGAAMAILVPLFAPVILHFGLDPCTSIVAIIMCQAVGLCSPLCGLCLFVLCPSVGCSVGQLGRHVIKLSALIVLVAVILVLFPGLFSLATWDAALPCL